MSPGCGGWAGLDAMGEGWFMQNMAIGFSLGKRVILPVLAALPLLAPLAAHAVPGPYEKASNMLTARGVKAVAQGDALDAVPLLERAVVADPANARALTFLARAWQQQGKAQLARKYYDLALSIDPVEPDALNWSGQMALASGDKSAAQINRDRLGISCPNCPQHRELADAIAGVKPLNP